MIVYNYMGNHTFETYTYCGYNTFFTWANASYNYGRLAESHAYGAQASKYCPYVFVIQCIDLEKLCFSQA